MLTNAKNKIFDKKGYVIIRNLISKKVCTDCIEDLNKFDNFKLAIKNQHAIFEKKEKRVHLKYFKKIHLYIDSFNQLLNSRIFNVAKRILKQNVYYYNLGYHNKIPGSSYETPPHQDNFYWSRKPNLALTAYVALNKQEFKNGGIGYLAGSHKKKLHKQKKYNIAALSSFIDDKTIYESYFEFPKLYPGDVIFHHCNTIHRAAANNSKNLQRQAVAITIYGEKTKIDNHIQRRYQRKFQNK